jgi:hypothetical protein
MKGSIQNKLPGSRQHVKGQQPAPWHSIALFKITYQTRQINGKVEQRTVIHHLETDQEECWSERDPQRVTQWMDDRLTTDLALPEIKDIAVPEITQLQVILPHAPAKPLIANRTRPLFAGAISAHRPFALEISMHLTQSDLEQDTAYRVQCIAHDLVTRSTIVLYEMSGDSPLSMLSDRPIQVSNLVLPPSLYRLEVLVTLQSIPTTLSYFKVPMLQVV